MANTSKAQRHALMQKAIDEVENLIRCNSGSATSIRELCIEVASRHALNAMSLRSVVERRRRSKDKIHGNTILSTSQEILILASLYTMESRGIPLDSNIVIASPYNII